MIIHKVQPISVRRINVKYNNQTIVFGSMFSRGTTNLLKIRFSLVTATEKSICAHRLSCWSKLHTQWEHWNLFSEQIFKNQQKYRMLGTKENETQLSTLLDNAVYERVCTETLDALADYFEEIIEHSYHLEGSDVSYGDGVLTVKFGPQYGTYVINRQTPNKQIWLSSPTSGPKRYDFIGPDTAGRGKWIYKHTNKSLHELLQEEIVLILNAQKINFFQLPYSSYEFD